VLVFPATAALPLSRYYAGQNPLVPLPADEDFRRYDPREYVLASADDIDARLSNSAAHSEEVWLVRTEQTAALGIDFRPDILDDYVRKRFVIRDETRFRGSRLLHLTRRR
jgi:hypothetical protein